MKKFLIQFILLSILIFFALALYTNKIPTIPFLPQPVKEAQIIINESKIKVAVADTREKRSKGLSGRSALGEGEGMLFIFEKPDKYPFWMKGVSFPLDFVWINGEKVVDFTENVPPPVAGSKDADLPIYVAKEPIDKLLEIPAGTVAKLNIKTGDAIKLSQ
ncbi:DUF192 domain-containing protein [Candidatus Daviesbacteria bacterium]|nr:DUF192 domain-containing protein [Candidatus Daviesbacteria bacterium]